MLALTGSDPIVVILIVILIILGILVLLRYLLR